MAPRRKKSGYFKVEDGAPAPVSVKVKHRVSFSEVDPMAIAWHGRYAQFFELASEELITQIGLTYKNYYENGLQAPIVQLHVDYHSPLTLSEIITVEARLHWSAAARLNIEYTIYNQLDEIAATGYTVQMFSDYKSTHPLLVLPDLISEVHERWLKGEYKCL